MISRVAMYEFPQWIAGEVHANNFNTLPDIKCNDLRNIINRNCKHQFFQPELIANIRGLQTTINGNKTSLIANKLKTSGRNHFSCIYLSYKVNILRHRAVRVSFHDLKSHSHIVLDNKKIYHLMVSKMEPFWHRKLTLIRHW